MPSVGKGQTEEKGTRAEALSPSVTYADNAAMVTPHSGR